MRTLTWTLLLGCLAATACGSTVYAPSRQANFSLDAEFEINDDDIRKAFEARPQLPDHIRVAYYSFDPSKKTSIESVIAKLPRVVGVYEIPSLMVTGERRIDESQPRYYNNSREPMSLKKLRLLSARAHCDLLLVVDHSYRVEEQANGLAALDLLILPVLFMPQVDVVAESFVDTYAIDVRNGYLYAHVASSEKDIAEYETVWTGVGDALLSQQWEQHMESTEAHLERVIEESGVASAPPHVAPESAARAVDKDLTEATPQPVE